MNRIKNVLAVADEISLISLKEFFFSPIGAGMVVITLMLAGSGIFANWFFIHSPLGRGIITETSRAFFGATPEDLVYGAFQRPSVVVVDPQGLAGKGLEFPGATPDLLTSVGGVVYKFSDVNNVKAVGEFNGQGFDIIAEPGDMVVMFSISKAGEPWIAYYACPFVALACHIDDPSKIHYAAKLLEK